MYNIFKQVPNNNVIVVDVYEMFDQVEGLINKGFETALDPILEDMSNQFVKFRDSNYDKNVLNGINKTTLMFVGITDLLSRLSPEKKNELVTAISTIKDLGTYHIVLVDSSDKLKQQLYENWYKTAIDNTNGLWLGNGVLDQYAIKLATSPRELRTDLKPGFAVLVEKGKPFVIKYLGGNEDESQ